jgi:hypothetical protein
MEFRKTSGFCCCAGFWMPAITKDPRAQLAGVKKAPRHEVAGGWAPAKQRARQDFMPVPLSMVSATRARGDVMSAYRGTEESAVGPYAHFCGDWVECSFVVVGGNAGASRLTGDDPVSRQTAVVIVDVGQPINPRRAQNLCHGREMPHAQANETGGRKGLKAHGCPTQFSCRGSDVQ